MVGRTDDRRSRQLQGGSDCDPLEDLFRAPPAQDGPPQGATVMSLVERDLKHEAEWAMQQLSRPGTTFSERVEARKVIGEIVDRALTAQGAVYPREEGDVIVIGPECFAAKDGSVLNWRGVNYVPQPDPQGGQ